MAGWSRWKPENLLQICVTRASLEAIGFSAILANIQSIQPGDPFGASAIIGHDGRKAEYHVSAPIGPGMMAEFDLGSYHLIKPGLRERIKNSGPAMLALDGERKLILRESDQVEFALSLEGPYFINAGKALATKQIK